MSFFKGCVDGRVYGADEPVTLFTSSALLDLRPFTLGVCDQYTWSVAVGLLHALSGLCSSSWSSKYDATQHSLFAVFLLCSL